MSCIARESDFLRVNSFVWLGGICDSWWTFVVSFLINVILTAATILLATYRYREERHIAIYYARNSTAWKLALNRYFSSVYPCLKFFIFSQYELVATVNRNIFEHVYQLLYVQERLGTTRYNKGGTCAGS